MERKIPLSRVQDVRVEQQLIHRLLKVVELQVETAGGQGAEASLSVLSLAEAERLRAAIFAQKAPAATAPGAAASAASETPLEVIRKLTLRDLVKGGLTSNYLASALIVILVLWQQLDELLPPAYHEKLARMLGQSLEQWANNGGGVSWLALAGGAGLLLGLGLLFSVAGSIIVFYGFTLSRRGEDLHRAYGLFTRRASSLARRRVQVLKIEEPWLRRLLGLATLRADTAGSAAQGNEEKSGGRDVLLPVVPKQEVEGLLDQVFPDLERAADWRLVSRRAIRRGTLKGAWVCGLFAVAAYVWQQSWAGLWPLAFIPVVYGLNVLSYRYLGYRPGERYFWTRQGWLSRATHIVPVRNVQVLMVHQTPLDRWHRVATVLVDTAGQAYTGGGAHINNVPAAEALALARELAAKAAPVRYRC